VTIKMVVAPSGSGKSYLARKGVFVDGDHEPRVREAYSQLNKAFSPRWWDRADYVQRVKPIKDALLNSAFEAAFRDHKGSIPIATAEIGVAKTLIESGQLGRDEVVAWIPSAEEITERQALRLHNLQPKNSLDKNRHWIAHFKRNAEDLNIKIVESDVWPAVDRG
jgi:hypothetical protein